MTNEEKIKKLKELANAPEVTKGFPSQAACIQWVNEVGKVINHNHYFYQVFSEQADIINTVGLRQGNLYATAINKLLTLINQVITDLEAGYPKMKELDPSKTPEQETTVKKTIERTDLTIADLIFASNYKVKLLVVGIFLAGFGFGLTLGASKLYKEKISPLIELYKTQDSKPK